MKDYLDMIIKNVDVDRDHIGMIAWLSTKMDVIKRVDNIIFASDIIEECEKRIKSSYKYIITGDFAIYAYKDSVKYKYEDIFIGSKFIDDLFYVKDPVRFMYVYFLYKRHVENEKNNE